MRDFPIEEPAHVSHVRQFETKEFTVELEVVIFLDILIVFHALRNEHVLTSVDHLVDLALHISQLILLLVKLVWLSQLVNIPCQAFYLLGICCALHF